MSNMGSSLLPERNPVTQKAHRREVFRQITIPLLVGVIAVLFLAVLASLGAAETQSRWADISLIWLILPMLLISLILLVLLAAFAYGVVWLIRTLPIYARRVQNWFATIGAMVHRVGDAVVEPIIRAQSLSARLQTLRRSTANRRR